MTSLMHQTITHLLGAIRAYVPSGQAILKSVLTTALPPAGTTLASAADRSNPADWGDPRVGILALGPRNFTWRTFDILREWIGRMTMLLLQQARSAEWRRRRSRGGMVMVLLQLLFDLCGLVAPTVAWGSLGHLGGFV
eukprot:scaffold8786_cov188-Skeletonema_menzelii.AAC.4